MPLKSYGNSSVLVADVGKAEDSGALQYNIVRINGQRSVYVPDLQAGGRQQHHHHREWHEGRDQSAWSIFLTA